MYIITGLGRCGTSIITKYLGSVGFGLGKNINWHNKANAGLELSTFYAYIDDFYNLYIKKGIPIDLDKRVVYDYWKGLSYREIFNRVDKDERQGKVDIVKDPRITWHPDIIEALWECRQDIKLIICHRKPEDVKHSRETLPVQYGDPKPRKELSDYKIDFCDFYTRVLELEIPYITLYFPNFISNNKKLHKTLCDFGLVHEYDEEKFKLFDKNVIGRRDNK